MPLSDTRLRTVRPTGERFELADRHGLALRVGASGTMTWSLTYRVRGQGEVGEGRVARLAGPKRRMALGTYPAVSLSAARKAAVAALSQAASGIDPGAAQRAQAAAQAGAMTVSGLIDHYVTHHLRPHLRSGGAVEAKLRRHVLPAWGDRPVVEITRGDLLQLLDQVRNGGDVTVKTRNRGTFTHKRGGPGAAAEVRKWVRAMFQYAVDAEIRADNPFAGVKNRDRQKPRDRVLSMEELRAVWAAACALPYPWGPFYQLLMLTGCRRGEWATACWSWLDAGWLALEIPAEHYKTSRSHLVPLSNVARGIVSRLERGKAGDHLFSTDGGLTAIANFSEGKDQLTRGAEAYLGMPMAPWVVHDLRRSMATHMERIGIAPHVIEACLGHTLKGVAGIYRRYNFAKEKREALQLWADELQGHALQAVA